MKRADEALRANDWTQNVDRHASERVGEERRGLEQMKVVGRVGWGVGGGGGRRMKEKARKKMNH